jgi:hypothetical protein
MHYKKDRIIPEQKALDKTLITEWNWEKKK